MLYFFNTVNVHELESPAVARKDALQPVQFLLQYWPPRSSKVMISISSKKRMTFAISD